MFEALLTSCVCAERPADAQEKTRTLKHQVTPLCDLTYEEQIEFKRHMLVNSLEKVTKRLMTEAATGSGVEWVRALAKGPICPLEKLHHSPDLLGYRNKNEFTIGYGEDGKPVVSFLVTHTHTHTQTYISSHRASNDGWMHAGTQ
jgi:tRNA (uracil-5-)-methyltransferase